MCLFALVCLQICVSAIFFYCAFFFYVAAHSCVPICAVQISQLLGQSSLNQKSDSLYSTLCDILPFIFPLRLKSKSLLSLAQLSLLEVSLAKKKKKNSAMCLDVF